MKALLSVPIASVLFVFAVWARAAEEAAPPIPENASKAELIAYQETLTRWGNERASTSDEFWQKTSEYFYASGKELMQKELDASERSECVARFASLLAGFAIREATESGEFGPKFDELRVLTAKEGERYFSTRDEADRGVFLDCAEQLFAVRLRAALAQSGADRENALVALIGDAITLALKTPEFGEKVNALIASVRAYEPELGREAYEAMCDAFDASGEPILAQPIQHALGERRFANLPGTQPYCDALLLENGEFSKNFDWDDYKGKVVLLEIWATWCGPCRKEIPRLKEVYAKYRDAGFEIVGYSIDRDVDRLKSFLVENEIPWAMASQEASVASGARGLYEYYSINGVPEMILVDRDGKTIMTDARGVKLAKALEELFPDVEPLGWDPAQDFSARVKQADK